VIRLRTCEAVQRHQRWSRPAQRKLFDERHELRRRVRYTSIRSSVRVEGGDAAFLVELMPALQCAEADAGVAREGGEGYLVFDVESENPPPLVTVHGICYMAVLSRSARACW